MPSLSPENNSKILPLESLRGIAALAVVFDHYFRTFYPYTFVDTVASHSRFEWLFIHTPLFVGINGAFAVVIFFTLSGFVLSHGFFSGKRFDFISASLKRYIRLTPVVFVSIIIAFVLLKLNLFFNDNAGLMPVSWKDNSVSLLSALWEGLVGIYAVQPGDSSLNSVLWTIYHELIGSIMIFSLLAAMGHDSRRKYVYPILLIMLVNTPYVSFIAGMLIADLYSNRKSLFASIQSLKLYYRVPLWLFAIYLGSFPPLRTLANTALVHKPVLFLGDYTLNAKIVHLTGAALLIILLLTSKRFRKLFEFKPLVGLGSISYSLYAIHLIVLGSIGCFVFYKLHDQPYNYAALASFIAYVTAAILCAVIINRLVDIPSIRLSRYIGRKIRTRS